ncbi:MAG: hypothetical protein H5U17_17525 [Defluviimonas sp.]|nr:hypothetical protein [Defluviimonas sp.]
MIISTRGKLAAGAVQGHFGKGFPADLVRRTRAMLSALDAAMQLEDLRFPRNRGKIPGISVPVVR